jgi:glycolate oxidase FAD binding subunit
VPDPDIELRTTGLHRIAEHNEGDLTAVLEAGTPLKVAQATFAAASQMLALDPPLGRAGEHAATIGGVLATADSGPLRHRYGAPRDLVLGVTVALADGTLARSGGKVIKNVAGYDLAKLFSGSFGTLGLILSVSVRLHPLHEDSCTAVAATGDAAALTRAAVTLTGFPAEFEALDFAWRSGRGGILARCAGSEATRRAQRAARQLSELGLDQVDVVDPDGQLWERQRAGQRSADRALVRVSASPTALTDVLRAADTAGATVVGRAAVGSSYLEVDGDGVAPLRDALPAEAVAVVLDAPSGTPDLDRWGTVPEPALALMRRVKERFDPARTCNPGLFVGGI